LEINDLNETEKCSVLKENTDEKSSALCFWYIVTAANVCDNNIKPYFPQREINEFCIVKDIKLMLLDLGTIYFLVDEVCILYNYLFLNTICIRKLIFSLLSS